DKVLALLPGNCRNAGRCHSKGSAGLPRVLGLPVFVGQPSEHGMAVGCVAQKARLSGDIAEVPRRVAAERSPVVVDVVDEQRQRPQAETSGRKNYTAGRNELKNAADSDHWQSQSHSG